VLKVSIKWVDMNRPLMVIDDVVDIKHGINNSFHLALDDKRTILVNRDQVQWMNITEVAASASQGTS